MSKGFLALNRQHPGVLLIAEMPTSGDLKSADSLFTTPPPPPQKFNEPMPPFPPPKNMGMTKDIIWKTMTFLCSYLSLCGVVTSLCLVVSSLFGLFTDVMWFRLYVLLTSLPVQSSSTQALLVTSN